MKADIASTFEKIYAGESDAIFRFCLVRVSDREQALDIVQETFLRLWQTLTQGKEIMNIRAFLFTVTHRLIIDWYRKKKSISLESLMHAPGHTEFEPKDEKAARNLDVGIEGRYLLDKIGELSPGYRYPVYLRFVEDLSPGEIAVILGISTNAASVRINRGLVELRMKTGYNDDTDATKLKNEN
jgi:RNA polymerase sigma-70 factor (ECF subfamily)